MGLWVYAGRILTGAWADFRAHRAWLAATLAGMAVGTAGLFGINIYVSPAIPWAVFAGSVLLSLFRSAHRLQAEVAERLGEGVVIRFLDPLRIKQTSSVIVMGWPQRPWHAWIGVEVTNHLPRSTSLCVEALFVLPEGEVSCFLIPRGNVEPLYDVEPRERTVLKSGESEQVVFHGLLRVEQPPQHTPKLRLIRVTDFAVLPERTIVFTAEQVPGAMKLV